MGRVCAVPGADELRAGHELRRGHRQRPQVGDAHRWGTLNGVYSYFYDAFGRRRAKTTPWSTTDEYFYDTGHQMLSDRGSDTVGASATTFPEDDYVWLGGRPVAVVRGKFNASTWARSPDGFGASCDRDSVAASCGTFMLVTDSLGKPVLMLDRGTPRARRRTRGSATSLPSLSSNRPGM